MTTSRLKPAIGQGLTRTALRRSFARLQRKEKRAPIVPPPRRK